MLLFKLPKIYSGKDLEAASYGLFECNLLHSSGETEEYQDSNLTVIRKSVIAPAV
jgi:hypothetical protein